MQIYEDKSKCCGCAACAQSCPVKAITMAADEKGFLYPAVDGELCINCGICRKVCPLNQEHSRESTIKQAYGLQHHSDEVLKGSSSGGAFTAVSDVIISAGGYVYGAVLDKSDFSVNHRCAQTKEERDAMRGSKYVQSNTDGIFSDIREKLKTGKPVLFTGTPCENAALEQFLHGRPDNLFQIDLLCHGTPSPLILKEHVRYWEKKTDKKIVDFRFRTKRYVHSYVFAYGCEMDTSDGKTITDIETKRLIKIYTLNMRPSCYECPYASKHRNGDLTIGDYWKPQQETSVRNYKGTSVVFCNTEKGHKMLSAIAGSCVLDKVDSGIFNMQAVSHPVEYTESVDSFWSDYKEHGYHYVLDKYGAQSKVSAAYNMIWRTLYHLHLHGLAMKLGLR